MGNSETDGKRADEQRRAALLIALRTGLLKKCPTHDEVYDPGQHDYQGACMVAAFLVNRDDPLVAAFASDRTALHHPAEGDLRPVRGAAARGARKRESERNRLKHVRFIWQWTGADVKDLRASLVAQRSGRPNHEPR